MTAVKVLGIILLCLFLLSRIPIGAWVHYDDTGFLAKLKVGPLRFTLYPMKPKKKKAEPTQPPRKKPEKEKNVLNGGNFELIRKLIPILADAAGRLRRKISIDELTMDLLWSSPEPAACGIGYGAVNAAVGMIWPLIEQNFKIKSYRIRTGVDFDRGHPAVLMVCGASLTVGQGIGMAMWALPKLVKLRGGRRPAELTISET